MEQEWSRYPGYPALKRVLTVALVGSVPVMIGYPHRSPAPDLIRITARLARDRGLPFTAAAVQCYVGFAHNKQMTLVPEYGMFWRDTEIGDLIEESDMQTVLAAVFRARALPAPALKGDGIYVGVLYRFLQTYGIVDRHNLIRVSGAIAQLNNHAEIEVSDVDEALRYQYIASGLFRGISAETEVIAVPDGERKTVIDALIQADLDVRAFVLKKFLHRGFKGYDNMTWEELKVMQDLKTGRPG